MATVGTVCQLRQSNFRRKNNVAPCTKLQTIRQGPVSRVDKIISYVNSAIESPFEFRKVGQKRKSMTRFRKVSRAEKIYRTLLVIINIGWLMVAVLLFWASYWIHNADQTYRVAYRLMVDFDIRPIGYIFRAYAAVMICIALEGIFASAFEVASCLLSYICGVCVIIVFTAVLIVAVLARRSTLENQLTEGMQFCIDNFQYDFYIAQAVQQVQYYFDCCGLHSADDWSKLKDDQQRATLPISCCGRKTNVTDPITWLDTCSVDQQTNMNGCKSSPVVEAFFEYAYTVLVGLTLLNMVTVFMAGKLIIILWKW